jgi:hypothetical protein
MTAPTNTTADQTSSEANALINQDDSAFAQEFGLTDFIKAPEPAPAPDPESVGDAVEEAIEEATPREQPRDEQGRFAKTEAEGEQSLAEGEQPAAEPGTEAEPEPEPLRPLATEFVIRAKDGSEIPVGQLVDHEIEYKADGKVYKEPLDKIVRLAQTGRYNQRLHDELTELRTNDSEKTGRLSQTEAMVEQLRAEMIRQLTDDDYLYQRREEYARLSSPESEVERLRRELTNIKQSQAQASRVQAFQSFAESQLDPALQGLMKQYPSVTEDELLGRFYRIVTPFKRGGEVPPEMFDRVIQAVEGEIGPWMAHLHETRSATSAGADTKKQVELTKAREAATKAKNQLSRLQKPAVGLPGTRTTPKSKPIVSADDAMDDIIADVASKLVATA